MKNNQSKKATEELYEEINNFELDSAGEMEFQKDVDANRWKFFQFKEDGDEFIGRYINSDASTIHKAIEGIVFCDMEGEVTIIGDYYAIREYFKDKKEGADTVYKIVRKRKEQGKKNSFIVFDFYKSTPKK